MKKFVFVAGILSFAFIILFVSIFNSSSITYSLSSTPPQPTTNPAIPEINYILPYTGNILPDSPFWGLKALRDKLWFSVTPSHLRRAELALLFADKRLVMSQKLFERGETDIAISTFTKAEKYLPIAVAEEEIARPQGENTSEFLSKLAMAALKHKEIAENLILFAPEDARPFITKTEIYADNTFETARNILNSKGLPVPKNPFDRD